MLKSVKRAAHVFSASRVASLALLALFGCGSSAPAKQTPTPTPPPADSNQIDDPIPQTPSTQTTPTLDLPGPATQLARGGAILLGVTTDEQVVFLATGGTALPMLQVVPLAGGTPTTLIQAYDSATNEVVVSGGAVAIWTNISGRRGTFNLWTRAGGFKQNLTNTRDSSVGVFAATKDGARIAFGVDTPSSSSTNLAIADSATVGLTTSGIFDAASFIDTASTSCTPAIRFVQRALVAAYCAGTSSTASLARLYWVGDNSTNPIRLDEIGQATGNVKPAWFSDVNGTKIYTVAADGSGQARIVTPPLNGQAATSVALDNDAANAGFITNDGQWVVYRTPELGLRRASTGPNPNPQTLVSGVHTILDIASDLSKVLVHTLTANGSLEDIRAADVVTPNQTPHDIVPTATARSLGFTGDGQWVLYLDQISGSTNHLQSQSAMGGGVKDLAQNVDDWLIPENGPGAVIMTRDTNTTTSTTYSIKYVNASSGHVSQVLASQVPSIDNGGLLTVNHKLVWATNNTASPGVFVAPIP